jgi:nucleoside-triphosphatase THEP1
MQAFSVKRSEGSNNILVVSGKVHGGKTTFVSRLTEVLKSDQLSLAGFICTGSFSGGRRSAYTLVDLDDGTTVPFATIGERDGWIRFRRFCFNPEAVKEGERIIRKGIEKGVDLVVLDEVGPLELEGGGWSPLLGFLEKQHSTMQLWVAREGLLEDISHRWSIPRENVYRVDERAGEAIIEIMRKRIVGTKSLK